MAEFIVFLNDGETDIHVKAETPEEALRFVLESHKIAEVSYVLGPEREVFDIQDLMDGDASFEGFE